jgi:hypothetical protein
MDNSLQIVPDDDDRELEPLENPDLIWSKPVFPARTKPYSFTPWMLFCALQAYADSTDTQSDVFAAFGIESMAFNDLARRYPEIDDFHRQARRLKARKFGELAQKTTGSLPEEIELYQFDKDGNKSLTNAAAAFIKTKAEMALKIAKYHETGSFIETTRAENINRNVTFNVTGKPSDFNLDGADPGALIDAIRGRKPR